MSAAQKTTQLQLDVQITKLTSIGQLFGSFFPYARCRTSNYDCSTQYSLRTNILLSTCYISATKRLSAQIVSDQCAHR